MNDEIIFEKALMEKLPDLFYKNEKGAYIPCGCYCPVGWRPIVEDVLTSINNYIQNGFDSKRNPEDARFFQLYKKYWVPTHKFLYNAFDPDPISLKQRLGLEKKSMKDAKIWFPHEQEARRQSLGYKLQHNLHTVGDWLKKGRREFVSSPVPGIQIDQIKEKFGDLCIYITGGDKYIHGQLKFAKYLAGKTCMFTGEPGEKYNKNGWIVTASKAKIEEFENERK